MRLLRDYLAQCRDVGEASTAAEMIGFVESQPDCLLRSCVPGHLTGSAWIISPDRRRTLLTHHRKLDKWLQLGGHADGEASLLAVALREAREESGLRSVAVMSAAVFDLDRHWIPPRPKEAGHFHYDLRFLLTADPAEPLSVSSESKDLAWIDLAEVATLNPEESMGRMVRKTAGWRDG